MSDQPARHRHVPRLDYSAISDVGRVRKDNQDSGYAGPWLLAVCDGVGGAARGDIASSTAISQLRQLDAAPAATDRRPARPGRRRPAPRPRPDRRARRRGPGAQRHQHHRHGRALRRRPASASATSATAAPTSTATARSASSPTTTPSCRPSSTRAGSPRRRRGSTRTATSSSRRSTAIRDSEPDLFVLDLDAGDRLLLCSDGACGVLDDAPDGRHPVDRQPRLRRGRAGPRQPRGRQHRQRHLHRRRRPPSRRAPPTSPTPMLVGAAVGAAAETPLQRGRAAGSSAATAPATPASSSRSPAEIPDDAPFAIATDPIDPEAARYAPRPPRRFTWLRRAAAPRPSSSASPGSRVAAAWSWSQHQYYVGEQDGTVVDLPRPRRPTCPASTSPSPTRRPTSSSTGSSDFDAGKVASGIDADDLADAHADGARTSPPARTADRRHGRAGCDGPDVGP